MEPITLCGAVILVFGLWVELEPVITKVARALSNTSVMASLFPPTTVQKPLYVKYMTGIGT